MLIPTQGVADVEEEPYGPWDSGKFIQQHSGTPPEAVVHKNEIQNIKQPYATAKV